MSEPTSAVMRDGLVMNPHDAAIIDKAKCETSGEHLAEPGDLHCQRCGAELSIEDGARINEKYWETDTLPEKERPAFSGFTQEYVRRIQTGEWDFGPEPVKVDPNATLLGSELRYDTTPLMPRFRIPRVTVSREQLGLPPLDIEPDSYSIVKLPEGWWGLRNVRTDTVIVMVHGPGAKEDITDRWNTKMAGWLAWRARQDRARDR